MLDLVPFLTGVGEGVKALGVVVDVADDIHDAANVADNLCDIVDSADDVIDCTSDIFRKIGGMCFVAGTLVVGEDGNIPIEEIEAGDMVWAWDEETGDVALKEVVETYVNETDELVHLSVAGEEITCTPTHPFYSPVKGWTDAVHLRAGDILVLVNGEYVVVEKVQHEILEAPIAVYNFQVADYHTYYVSDAGVLVHNKCGRSGKQARLREMAKDDKLSSALRGEIKRDLNQIARRKRRTVRVPQGYNMAHRIGQSAKNGFSYKYSDLQPEAMHRLHHKIFGY